MNTKVKKRIILNIPAIALLKELKADKARKAALEHIKLVALMEK